MHFFRIAPGLVAVLAATSLQDSELPYRIISASRTLGGASARILSASIAASTAEIGEQDETQPRRPEELDIAQGRKRRGWRPGIGEDHQKMGRAAETSQKGEAEPT